ncbi:hypothetical protein ACPPVV_15080 [Rhodanobacter sp. Col0626]|uniref:hypothetical protein n=1 Tax=Rhodanobacter sp. Col0626 TaxID=3415679 RepID=UPI003CE8C089
MTRSATPLLTRLRRHRGLWALAIAVLLIKLVSSSICLADDPSARLAATQAVVGMTADSAVAGTSGDAACLLGEAGDCHCACAHALTLTSSMLMPLAPTAARMMSSRLSPGLVPDTTGSLLRPPIA